MYYGGRFWFILCVYTHADIIGAAGFPGLYFGAHVVYYNNYLCFGWHTGGRNDTDIVVAKGLKAGEVIAMEDPNEVAKRAKKL